VGEPKVVLLPISTAFCVSVISGDSLVGEPDTDRHLPIDDLVSVISGDSLVGEQQWLESATDVFNVSVISGDSLVGEPWQ